MKDVTTKDLIDRLILHTHKLSRFEAILLLDRSAKNASNVKAAQRYQRQALAALNRHFKQCIKEVQEHNRPTKKPAASGRKKGK